MLARQVNDVRCRPLSSTSTHAFPPRRFAKVTASFTPTTRSSSKRPVLMPKLLRPRSIPTEIRAELSEEWTNAVQCKYAIVVAKFNSLVTKSMLEGAKEAFTDLNIPEDSVQIVWVPGSFELPLVAKTIAKNGTHSAVICIGAVIRGGTSHYDAVVSAATNGVLRASMDTGVPVIFGVLTCDTMEQALDRAGGKMGNKGYEAAQTAIEMVKIMNQL